MKVLILWFISKGLWKDSDKASNSVLYNGSGRRNASLSKAILYREEQSKPSAT